MNMRAFSLNVISQCLIAMGFAVTTMPALAALDCQVLKQRIHQNIQSNGVKSFSLTVMDRNVNARGKVVGTCNGGKHKIMYINHARSHHARSKQRPWHDALANGTQALALPTLTIIEPASEVSTVRSDAAPSAQDLSIQEIAQLIDSMHQVRNESLYYNSAQWPDNMQTLVNMGKQSHGSVSDALMYAYKADYADGMFRFNVVCLLNRILIKESNLTHSVIAEQVAEHLVLALQDSDAWVRTEAVWGLQFSHQPKYASAVEKLLTDADANVAKEAKDTFEFLISINQQ